MKTAIFVEDGLFQVVLTPESDLEKMAVEKLRNLKNIEVYRGGFYACAGGWVRQDNYHFNTSEDAKPSTIFVCREKEVAGEARAD